MTRASATHTRDHAPVLHNCGPGPMTVYRTAAVGTEANMNSRLVIDALFQRVGITVSPKLYEVNGDVPLYPLHVYAAACAALVLLSPSDTTSERKSLNDAGATLAYSRLGLWRYRPTTAPRALAQLNALRALLGARSLLRPFHGIAQWSAHRKGMRGRYLSADDVRRICVFPAPAPWIPATDNADVAHLAWQLLAFAHVSPPLLLFSRPPSLAWFRSNGILKVRWFGTPGENGVSP